MKKARFSDIEVIMMRRSISLTAVTLAAALMLTGCVTTPSPKPSPTASATTKAITNPISDAVLPVGEAKLGENLNIQAIQMGVGYPNTTQMVFWGLTKAPATAAATPEPTATYTPPTLIETRRVVAMRYEVTNISDSPVDVKMFNPLTAYFDSGDITGGSAQADYGMESLHGSLKTESYPQQFASTNMGEISQSEWLLKPGETASWAVDWLIPESLQKENEVVLHQNFSLKSDEWSTDNKFTLKLTTD